MASEVDAGGTLTLKGTPLAELRVTDLKRELEHRGLSKSGSKIQLIERLKAQLLLEKLQQEAAQSSGDEHEGKVPNIALQQDDKAGQSEFVRQYLQQQQRNLEIQMGVKKQFEEERKLRSADESSADEESRPTNVADDDPELTSANQFKDDTSNAPAKEASKMPRPVRKSNRNSLKGEGGSVAHQGRGRQESPKLDKERQGKRSGSSSSRSPSPDRPSQNRRGRPIRAAARKVERSRSSSSSSSSTEEETPKRKQRPRNNSSSGSRSPHAASPKIHSQKPHRLSDADQAEKDVPHDGSGDKPVEKNENADKVVASGSRKKWRKKQPLAQALVDSTNSSPRIDSVTSSLNTTEDTKERENPQGEKTNSKDESDSVVGEPEQDVREVVSGSVLSNTVSNTAADQSAALSGKTKDAASEKGGLDKSPIVSEENSQKHGQSSQQKVEGDERVVEVNTPAKTPHNSSRRQQSRSSSSASSSARSRSRSPGGKKGARSRSSSSSSSDSETQSSGSSSDSSKAGSPKRTSKANGKAQVPDRKVSITQQKADEAEEMEVEGTKNRSPATSKTGHNEKVDRPLSLEIPASGEPKTKDQEEKLNNVDKEPENGSTEAKIELGVTPGGPDDSASRVAESSDKAKDADEESAAKKGIKRRKWNSKDSKAAKTTKRTTSMEISSDVLKNLIGDIKLTETVFEMETDVVNTLDYDDQDEDQRDVRVNKASSPIKEEKPEEEDARRVETRDASPELVEMSSEPEKKIIKLSSAAPKVGVKTKVKDAKKSKDDKKGDAVGKKENKQDTEAKGKVVAPNRVIKPLMPVVDEPEPMTDRQSPARNPPDRVIRIAGLVRPFTVNQLKELLRRSGELDDEYFWISDIKSHCLAAYKTQEQAAAARAALHGTRWPQSNPKILFVDFATIDDVMHRKQEGKVSLPAPSKRPQEDQKIKEPKIVEKEEKKHKAKDPKERNRIEREKDERETKDKDTKERKRETEKKNFVREWDRDKVQQLSRSRSKSKDRERLARRSRSREREQRKRGDFNKEKREEDRRKEKKQKEAKAEEEPPAKLLDDLFRKTKATPCIYWLPLTEEQAQPRMVKRLEEEKERKKRMAAAEKELKKNESARLDRLRERDRPREKDGNRERDRPREKDGNRERDRAREKDRDRSKPERKTSRSSSRSRSRRRR